MPPDSPARSRTSLLKSIFVGVAACSAAPPLTPAPAESRAELARPAGRLKQSAAEQYALELVNRDRAAEGLPSLAWDATAAAAARAHSSDMARGGFTAHLGSAGDAPEDRLTNAGVEDAAYENVACLADGAKRALDADPLYLPEEIERVESGFLHEVPPHDGHRRNLLGKLHTSAGIGLAKAQGAEVACMTQEMVDDLGQYAELPRTVKGAALVHVEGELRAPATVMAVGVARAKAALPMASEALNRTHDYMFPAPFAMFYRHGFKGERQAATELDTDPTSHAFRVDLPLGPEPGRYEISVWARLEGQEEPMMTSLRVIEVR